MSFQLAAAYVELSQRGFSGVLGGISQIGSKLSGLISPIGLVSGALGALGAGAGIGGMIKLAAESEGLATQFETLLGSADAAKQTIAELKEFGAKTPFEFPGLAQTAKNLLAFGVAQDQVLPTLQVLGDMASATGQDLNELGGIYGKIKAQGKLSMETVMQLQERSIPIVNTLAQQFGKTDAEIQKMVSDGKIGFGDVQGALQSMTAEGGRFFGGMERQSQTLGGLWSTLTDEITSLMTDIGSSIVEGFDLKDTVSNFSDFIANFKSWFIPTLIDGFKWVSENIVSPIWNAITYIAGAMYDLVANFDLYWQLAYTYVANWMMNAWERVKTFGINVVEIISWAGKNWKDILFSAIDASLTFVINLGKNIRALWQAVLDFISGKGFNVDWTPMMDGFQSAISEMPQLTKAQLNQLQPEIDALYGQIDQRHAESQKKAELAAAERQRQLEGAPEDRQLAIDQTTKGGTAKDKKKGREFEFTNFASLAEKMQTASAKDAEKKIQENQLDVQKQIAANTARPASAPAPPPQVGFKFGEPAAEGGM